LVRSEPGEPTRGAYSSMIDHSSTSWHSDLWSVPAMWRHYLQSVTAKDSWDNVDSAAELVNRAEKQSEECQRLDGSGEMTDGRSETWESQEGEPIGES